jgi:GlcNAc-P-P-Und epimerase
MKKFLIFGGSGFVGTRLISRINQEKIDNLKIVDIAYSKDYPEFHSFGDIRNLDSFKHLVPEGAILINLAAEHRDDVHPKSLYDQVNVHGAHNLCKIATEKNIKKIIFTSSVAVYGFALLGTDESGEIHPFNDYGRTKWEAEQVYKKWQLEDPENRTLVIVRPTVIFGERNRGNVFNLLKQIASGKFVMIGNGFNRKSMAYVENVAAFLEYSLNFKPGIHLYNYIDKPDFSMNQLVTHVNKLLNRSEEIKIRLPYWLGFAIGKLYDVTAFLTKKKFAVSSIRVKKFCADSVYESAIDKTGFIAPVPLMEAIKKTVNYEFIEAHQSEQVFYTE